MKPAKDMNAREALDAWHTIQDEISYQELQTEQRHQLIHELAGKIRLGIDGGAIQIGEV